MELIPTVDALGWIADAGQQILSDERIPQPQAFTKLKKSVFSYEPLGVILDLLNPPPVASLPGATPIAGTNQYSCSSTP